MADPSPRRAWTAADVARAYEEQVECERGQRRRGLLGRVWRCPSECASTGWLGACVSRTMWAHRQDPEFARAFAAHMARRAEELRARGDRTADERDELELLARTAAGLESARGLREAIEAEVHEVDAEIDAAVARVVEDGESVEARARLEALLEARARLEERQRSALAQRVAWAGAAALLVAATGYSYLWLGGGYAAAGHALRAAQLLQQARGVAKEELRLRAH